MTTILTTLAFALLLAVTLLSLRRAKKLERRLGDARWKYARERQRANVLRICLEKDAAAKTVMLNQMRWMERRFAHMCIRRRRWRHFSAYRQIGAWKIVRPGP